MLAQLRALMAWLRRFIPSATSTTRPMSAARMTEGAGPTRITSPPKPTAPARAVRSGRARPTAIIMMPRTRET